MSRTSNSLMALVVAACAAALAAPALSSGGSGGGGGGGGGAAAPTGGIGPGPVYLQDSFGMEPLTLSSGARLDAAGNSVAVWLGHDLSGLRAEYPNNSAEVWTAPGGKRAQTWGFSVSSHDPYEPFSASEPLAAQDIDNGSITVTGGTVNTFPDALLPFPAPAGAYQASIDAVSNSPGTAIGFTSSGAVNGNFASSGQIWLVLHTPLGQGGDATWELHTNGLKGPSLSGTITAAGYDQLAISYDPATHTVVGSINGVPTAAITYAATGVKYVGIEGLGTVDDFIVQAGSLAPAGQ